MRVGAMRPSPSRKRRTRKRSREVRLAGMFAGWTNLSSPLIILCKVGLLLEVGQVQTEIGEAAGKIWAYIDSHGPTTLGKLKTGTRLADDVLHQAIGWLAREEKIALEKKGRTTSISLC